VALSILANDSNPIAKQTPMSLASRNAKLPANDLGVLLRHWRDRRGRSQFDLALDAGVSQRHISFIESGRSVPGRQVLMAIAQGLDVPLRDRNALLLAAGYAPLYSEGAWNAPEMQSITKALERILRQHEPFPAVVMDRYWNVLMTNDAAPDFFNRFVDMAARPSPRNLLHLMFDPKGMRPFIANWEELAKSLFERVYREAVGRVLDEKTRDLMRALQAYPDVKTEWKNPEVEGAAPAMPIIPVSFVKDGAVLNYFSMVTSVGTPKTIAAQELRIECMFPADDATETRHIRMMKSAPNRRAKGGGRR
jgi:transcriptional regulator with XRE-family HTH domain